MAVGLILSPAAYAADEHDFKASISEPAAVAPGGTGEVRYEVTNVSDEPTDGALLNVSLPPHVMIAFGEKCQQTGTNDAGGQLISCNFSGEWGKFAPGQTKVANAPFQVAPEAPAATELGTLGALVVPLENGEPTEDWTRMKGHNVVSTPITTAGSGGSWWGWLASHFG